LQLRAPAGSLTWFPAALGAGEQDAIAIAEELHTDLLLVDDWASRREAERRLVPIQGKVAC